MSRVTKIQKRLRAQRRHRFRHGSRRHRRRVLEDGFYREIKRRLPWARDYQLKALRRVMSGKWRLYL